MSLCDICFAPGQCCKRLHLTTMGGGAITVWDDKDPVETLTELQGPHQFFPIEKTGTWEDNVCSDEDQRLYSAFIWGCSALGPDGRCTIYEDRPQVCRDYAPASSPLCVHFGGAEGT